MEKLPKYCDTRFSKKEGKYYRHNPSAQMRELLGIKNEPFKDLDKLNKYAAIQLQRLKDALRRNKGMEFDPQSVRGLVADFLNSSYYIKLKPNSKESYTNLLEFGLEFIPRGSNKPFGDYPYKSIDRAFVDRFNVSIGQNHSEHKIFHVNKVFRRVYNVGLKHQKLTHNPFTMQELKNPESRKVLWTEEYLQKFIRTADELDYSSIGTIALFCFTLSQRPGDIRQLKNENLQNGILSFTQEKSVTCKNGAPVHLSFNLTHTPLNTLLDRLKFISEKEGKLREKIQGSYFVSSKGNHGYRKRFICNGFYKDDALIQYETTGLGLSKSNIIHATQLVRKVAGIPKELQMRDLRATGATNLGLAGCSTNELMSVTGHKDPKTVQIYMRNAEEMRANAFTKLASKSSGNHSTN